jgi:CheY-like chemotaxis protein
MMTIAPNALETWRVLIVEDVPDNADLVARLLGHFGAQVMIARNGAEALDHLGSASYTLIVCDLSMPELDGWAFITKMRDSDQSIPVIALTAHAMSADRDQALAAGFTGYYTKPIVDVLHLVNYLMTVAAAQ